MKTQTKKILLTQKGEINKSFLRMIQNCRFNKTERKIYTDYYSGSGRFTSAHSSENTILSILKAQGYKFEKGNDAPKGGILGNFIKVSKTAFEFIENLQN
jgi:hypothetical protein